MQGGIIHSKNHVFFAKIEMKSPKIIGSNKKKDGFEMQDFEVSKNTRFFEIRANVTCFAKFYWVGLKKNHRHIST